MKMGKGFTIIELMVTLAVVAITLVIGVPSMRDMIHNNRLAGQANELIAVMNYAKGEAITRGLRVSICPKNTAGNACSADWANGYIAFADTDGDGTFDSNEKRLRVSRKVESGNTLSAVEKDTTTTVGVVGFSASGNSASPFAVSYTLCDPLTHQSRIILLSLVGHTALTKSTC
jgi:type IV fimbrial biogenesis protein FimT